MTRMLLAISMALLLCPTPAARAQSPGADEPVFLFVGANGLGGRNTADFAVCADTITGFLALRDDFKQWHDNISQIAMQKMYDNNRCQLIGIHVVDNPARKYRNVESLSELAAGQSVYRAESGRLVLVKSFDASDYYVVATPEIAKTNPTLAELRLCGPPDLIDKLMRAKKRDGSNCHNAQQALYALQKAKDYPGPYATNAIALSAADFESLNAQGKFKGYVVYKLVGEELVPAR